MIRSYLKYRTHIHPYVGNKHGLGKYSRPGGEYVLSEWFAGAAQGRGTHVYADGTAYVGDFRANLPHGFGTMRHGNGSWYIGQHKDGMRRVPKFQYSSDSA